MTLFRSAGLNDVKIVCRNLAIELLIYKFMRVNSYTIVRFDEAFLV